MTGPPVALSIVGDARPDPAAPDWLPPRLRQLLVEHGAGLLAGQLSLEVPGSTAQAEMAARFESARSAESAPLGWGWLADPAATVVPLGEAMGSRGFLVHVELRIEAHRHLRPRLWFCHRWGAVLPAGNDLEDLLDALMAGMLVDIETWAVARSFIIERPAEILSIEPTYDMRAEPSAAALRAALATRDEKVIDDEIERFLGWGLPVDRLPLAERLARSWGAEGNAFLETVTLLRKRGAERERVAAVHANEHSPLAEMTSVLVELGLTGRRGAYRGENSALLRFAGALPPNACAAADVRKSLDAARAAKPSFFNRTFLDALSACSLEEARAVFALATAFDGRRPWFADVGHFDPASPALPVPWADVAPLDRLWPLVAILLFGDGRPAIHAGPLVAHVKDRRFVPVLDAFLAKEDDCFFSSLDEVAAAARTALAPLTEDDVGGIGRLFAERGPPPKRYAPCARGLLRLLALNAKLDAAFRLLAEQATRGPELACIGAQLRGKDAPSLELLRRVWSDVTTYSLHAALGACRVAVSFGDAGASAALEKLEKAVDREWRRVERRM